MQSGRYLRRDLPLWLALGFMSIPAAAQRMVFAHYMLANQDYEPDDASGERNILSYEKEIRQAQSIGIDGFALNAGGWFQEPRYIRRAAEMFEAATRLHSNFKLMFSADMCCSNDSADLLDMMRRFANNERYAATYFRHNDKFVLTTFAGSAKGPEFWLQLRRDLEQGTHPSLRIAPAVLTYASTVPSSAPMRIELVPAFFWGGERPQTSDIRSGLSDYASLIDGAFYWGIAGVPGLDHSLDQLPSSEAYASVLHQAGKLYMAPICFQFWGANAGRYYEYSGYAGMRTLWMNAINVTRPDWVEIITWNDFIEGTYISPIDDPARYSGANDLGASVVPPSSLHFFHSHEGVATLMAYFIKWYKTGAQPAILHDEVYWAYRTQLSVQPANGQPPIKLYGPVSDSIYVTANLTAASVLQVITGGVTKTFHLPAGSTDLIVPLLAGAAPQFELIRGASKLLHSSATDPVSASSSYPDLYLSTGFMVN
jgi:glucan endo-1,3-alpha-glucosidase